MSTHRIFIVLIHTWHHFTHSMETWVDLFWNSIMQMLVYVFIALVFASNANVESTRSLIMGAIFWNVIWTAQYSVCVGALWEIWSRSFSSLFITPLTLGEFLIGQMVSGFIKSILVFALTAAMAAGFYHFSVFDLGWMLPISYVLFMIFAWGLGMLILSMIFRYGTEVQALSWAIVFLVQPLGGVFYPVDVLPVTLRWAAYGMPTTYIFESMRYYLKYGVIPWEQVGIGTALSVAFLVVGYAVLRISHRRALVSGAFARMEG